MDGGNNKVILDSNKRNDNNDNNNSIEQNNDVDIPLDNSGVKRINHCNNNLIDEPIENFICSDLDVIEKPKESLSDNIIVTSLIVTLISSKILMTATEIEMMIVMKILLYQIISDQPILMEHLELRRHPILRKTTTETWIQN